MIHALQNYQAPDFLHWSRHRKPRRHPKGEESRRKKRRRMAAESRRRNRPV
jgi:hypothetical protein